MRLDVPESYDQVRCNSQADFELVRTSCTIFYIP